MPPVPAMPPLPPRPHGGARTGTQTVEEPAGAAARTASRRAGERPGDGQALPGPGDSHVEEATLLLDLLVGLGVGDRHHAFGDADQEDDIPLQALGRVQGGQGDALDGRGVLGVRPFVQLGDQVGEGGAGLRGGEVLREADQRGQRLPAFSDGPGVGRWLRGPTLPRQDGTYLGGQVDGVLQESVVAAEASRAAQGDARLADLGAVEETLRAAQLVRDAAVGEGLLVGLRLRVGAEQDGDLRGRRRRLSRSSRIRRAAPSASAGSSGYSP